MLLKSMLLSLQLRAASCKSLLVRSASTTVTLLMHLHQSLAYLQILMVCYYVIGSKRELTPPQLHSSRFA